MQTDIYEKQVRLRKEIRSRNIQEMFQQGREKFQSMKTNTYDIVEEGLDEWENIKEYPEQAIVSSKLLQIFETSINPPLPQLSSVLHHIPLTNAYNIAFSEQCLRKIETLIIGTHEQKMRNSFQQSCEYVLLQTSTNFQQILKNPALHINQHGCILRIWTIYLANCRIIPPKQIGNIMDTLIHWWNDESIDLNIVDVARLLKLLVRVDISLSEQPQLREMLKGIVQCKEGIETLYQFFNSTEETTLWLLCYPEFGDWLLEGFNTNLMLVIQIFDNLLRRDEKRDKNWHPRYHRIFLEMLRRYPSVMAKYQKVIIEAMFNIILHLEAETLKDYWSNGCDYEQMWKTVHGQNRLVLIELFSLLLEGYCDDYTILMKFLGVSSGSNILVLLDETLQLGHLDKYAHEQVEAILNFLLTLCGGQFSFILKSQKSNIIQLQKYDLPSTCEQTLQIIMSQF